MKFRPISNKEKWNFDKYWKGKKKGYIVRINQQQSKGSNYYNKFWFVVNKDDIDFRFNSLWKGMYYETLEECCSKAEEYIDKIIKEHKSSLTNK